MPNDALPKNDELSLSRDATAPRAMRFSLPITLLRAREAVMSHFRPMLAAHDVTEQQWRVIRVLYEEGTLDASEVAERAFILAPSLTRMLRSLEERGFITRHKDKIDGRRVLLTIAPAGIDIIKQVLPDSRKIYADITSRFSHARLELLLELLDELATLRSNDATEPLSDE